MARGIAAIVGFALPVIGTLLALGVITPFGAKDALGKSVGRTVEAGTSRLNLRVVSDADGRVTRYTAAGAFDYRTAQGRLRYDFSATTGLEGATFVDARFNDGVVFLRFPAGSGIPARRPWVRADLEATDKLMRDAAESGALPEAAPDLGVLADVGVTDPSRVLEDLRRSGEVEDLGEARLFGAMTRKFRGTLGGGASGSARVTTTAWIGEGDLIRRLALSGDGTGGRVKTTMDFSDFGTTVDAEPPPADEVTDIVEVLARLVTG